MTPLVEGNLQIALPAGMSGRKFDDDTTHGLSHCMKAVDFIVEAERQIFFIEFKDPEHPTATPKDRAKFLQKLMSGALDSDLKTKYRDSWRYEFAEGRVHKPIYYLVLIAASTLSSADLLIRTDALKRQLPMTGPGERPWQNPFIAGCAVMNLDAWNKTWVRFPVSRRDGK